MGKTVVISIRVPEEIVEHLKKSGKKPGEIAKKALIRASIEEEAKKLNEIGKRITLPPWEELKKMVEEGRA